MSGNSASKNDDKRTDRRVRRTRDALGDALIALMQEKPFDEITVDDVLKRAGVGRSTFYAHFAHKEDLFLSDAEEFFEALATYISRTGETSRRVLPVRELFAHVGGAKDVYAALVASGKYHDLVEMGSGIFARAIERRFSELGAHQEMLACARSALAEGLAGAVFAMLTWWVKHDQPDSPAAMDEAFHRLVWPGT